MIGVGMGMRRRHRGTGTVIKDTFTRADNTTSIGKTETGQVWNVVSGTWGIRTNKGYNPGDGNGQVLTTDAGLGLQFTASMDITGEYVTNSRFLELILHYVDTNNYLFLRLFGSSFTLSKRIAAVNTTAVQVANTAVNGTTYNIKIVNTNGKYDMYLDNVFKMTYTLLPSERALYLPISRVGVRMDKAGTPTINADFDNFIVTRS